MRDEETILLVGYENVKMAPRPSPTVCHTV